MESSRQTTPDAETPELKEPLATALEDAQAHPLARLGSARKHCLLFIFAVAQFVDICNVSGVGIEVAQLAKSLDLAISQLVWVSLPLASVVR